MLHVLTTLKKEHPALRKASFRQDNAGCYHSSRTILACQEIAVKSGIRVARVDFSDPQGGKGAADRLAATCKAHVRAYINEGHDVCTATDLTTALLSHGGIAGVRVVCLDTIAETPDESPSITGITKLNNFEFSSDGSITCWRAYGVGKGKKIKPDKAKTGSSCMLIEEGFSEGDFRGFATCKEKKQTTTSPTASLDSVEGEQSENPNSGVYYCPNSSCVRVFLRLSALERHISLEKCTQSLEKYSLIDLAKMGYKKHLEEGFSIPATLRTTPSQENTFTPQKEGWALKAARKAYRFSEKQKKYLQANFRIGQTTGRKLDAEMVARAMRRARGSDGARLFQTSEFLSTSQVASFFSRQSAFARQKDTHIVDDTDVVASEMSNFSEAQQAALAIELQHPLVYDQYDLCSMALEDSIKLLKLPLLQQMCEGFGLDVPSPPVRKRAPYLALLHDITRECTCRRT